MQCGGPASTTLVTLSRLGIRTAFLGSISDDPFGMKILAGLRVENVDTTFLKIIPGFTSQFAFIAISKRDGRRTIFWHRGSVPHLRPDDVDLTPFPNAHILHVDGLMIEAAVEAARLGKDMGLMVVMDAGTQREGSLKLTALADVLIASERFAEPLLERNSTPEMALRALRKHCSGDVIITRGSKGSIGLKDKEIIHQEAFPVEAVDTTGAGDVYHGAYIYGLLQDWGMSRCMHFASAASALKCMHLGARQGIPTKNEIECFLSQIPDKK